MVQYVGYMKYVIPVVKRMAFTMLIFATNENTYVRQLQLNQNDLEEIFFWKTNNMDLSDEENLCGLLVLPTIERPIWC